MSYQPINKPIPKYYNGVKVFGKKRDCEDFESRFWDRRYCKFNNKCKRENYYCEYPLSRLRCYYPEISCLAKCTGITIDRWQEIIS